MDINNSRYELTAVRPEQYPAGIKPEAAFLGRSNAGKSSMINKLLNKKNLARVSSEPGKTREINFYNIDDQMYLVDLPGYGYAKVSKGKKQFWGEVIETYLNTRSQLQMLVLMVDIRHTPTDDDKVMYQWMEAKGLPHMVIASKADKISKSYISGRLQDIRKTLGVMDDALVIPFSAMSGQGRDDIWTAIKSAIALS